MAATKLLGFLGISASFRGDAMVRPPVPIIVCSLRVRWCGDCMARDRPRVDLGEAAELRGVAYGLSMGDMPPGDRAPGARRPNDPRLAMLLAVRLLA